MNHDPHRFELVCYSDTAQDDNISRRLRGRPDKWHNTVGLGDEGLAALIRADRIDILVDLVGHMRGHRVLVFARKPAPIQVTAWGEPTGTGLAAMDYLFADPVELPGSRLFLKGGDTSGDASQQERIKSVLATAGIAGQRVHFLHWLDRNEHFAAYQDIDIALDPFPHGGGMTTLDALWMGVPVVAFPGRTISSRLASATLSALGLTDFVAENLDSYVDLAVARASDFVTLARLRNTLRGLVAGSAFGDPRQYCRAVEAAYREMWQRWCAAH